MSRIMSFIRFGAAAAVAAGLLSSTMAKEITVPSSYDEETGTWIGDVVALTNAIKSVAESDTITLSNGVYNIAFMTNSPMYVQSVSDSYGLALISTGGKKKVKFRGATGDPKDVIIDATGSGLRAMALSGADSIVMNLTVKGGYVGEGGAGYNFRNGGGLLFASDGIVSNCIFTANYAARGGGAVGGPRTARRGTVLDSYFYENTAGANCGGAIRYCVLVSGCTIVSNKAFTANSHSHGGGGVAYCSMVTNCTIAYNYAKGSGGGYISARRL